MTLTLSTKGQAVLPAATRHKLGLKPGARHQERIERALAPKIAPGATFLHDVTSSYFEGQCNEHFRD